MCEHIKHIFYIECTPFQAVMYRCMASCCENSFYNKNDTQKCLTKCSGPAQMAQQYITNELQHWEVQFKICNY